MKAANNNCAYFAAVKNAPKVSRSAEREILAWCHKHPKDKRLRTVMIPRWCRKFRCTIFQIENVFWREAVRKGKREALRRLARVSAYLKATKAEGAITPSQYRTLLAILRRGLRGGER